VEIIDNFLPKKSFKDIKDTVISKLPYYYQENTAYKSANDSCFFFHFLYRDDQISSGYFNEIAKPILSKMNVFCLKRIKVNCYPSTKKINKHAFHRDWEQPHDGMLFYINTNNGLTIFKDGTEVKSVANRALFFDSSKLHRSTTCTDQNIRVNINFNYIKGR